MSGSIVLFDMFVNRITGHNYQFITTQVDKVTIKMKVKRKAEIPDGTVWVGFSADKCCVYANEKLV